VPSYHSQRETDAETDNRVDDGVGRADASTSAGTPCFLVHFVDSCCCHRFGSNIDRTASGSIDLSGQRRKSVLSRDVALKRDALVCLPAGHLAPEKGRECLISHTQSIRVDSRSAWTRPGSAGIENGSCSIGSRGSSPC